LAAPSLSAETARPVDIAPMPAEPAAVATPAPPTVASPPIPSAPADDASPADGSSDAGASAAVSSAIREQGHAREGAGGRAASADARGRGDDGGRGGSGVGAGDGALALAVPGDGDGVYGAYLNLLRRRVQEALRYPAAARRRGVGGTVHLDIAIDPTGRIERVEIARSSAHAALDEAALDAVRGLRR